MSDDLTRNHLERFVFNPHTALPTQVKQMAAELIDARARIAELERVQATDRKIIDRIQRARAESLIRITELEDERNAVVGDLIDARMRNAELALQLGTRAEHIAELEDELKDSRIALDEARVRMAPGERIGYITAYRNADGEWSIEFDGAPFTTSDEARADLVDVVAHALPGLTCRTLTVYDEEISNV